MGELELGEYASSSDLELGFIQGVFYLARKCMMCGIHKRLHRMR